MQKSNSHYTKNPIAYELHKQKMKEASRKKYAETKAKLARLEKLEEEATKKETGQ